MPKQQDHSVCMDIIRNQVYSLGRLFSFSDCVVVPKNENVKIRFGRTLSLSVMSFTENCFGQGWVSTYFH